MAMPRVEKDAEVTLVTLVFRSTRWLDFVMEGVDSSKQETRYRWCVVANDATPEVRNDPRVGVDWQNDDPKAFYIENVYRAWNIGVVESPTSLVIMLNSDMLGADHWIDELMAVKRANPRTVPTSLLIESGRLDSGMPEFVTNHGMNPNEFNRSTFLKHAESVRESGKLSPGRLYMPILIDRQEFIDVGSYPEGNPPGTTGDKDLIRRYEESGARHYTVHGSVVYHVQLGEQQWP